MLKEHHSLKNLILVLGILLFDILSKIHTFMDISQSVSEDIDVTLNKEPDFDLLHENTSEEGKRYYNF